MRWSRLLFGLSAVLLLLGGWTHAAAYPKVVAAVAGSNLPAYFGNALKALWLMDLSGMFVLATTCGLVGVRPRAASGGVMMLLALIPAATAALLYLFIGRFLGAHLLLVTSVAMLVAAASLPENPPRSYEPAPGR